MYVPVHISFFLFVYLQAIETFAVTVKEIAQVLQGFGSELSETDLPDEANAIEFLLRTHTHRYRKMKVALRLSLSGSFCMSYVLQAVAPVLCGFMSFACCFRTISVMC